MKFLVEKSFDRDIDKIKDKKLLQKLRDYISLIENADNLGKIPHVKKIEGYSSFYRIKIGDYRLGMELVSDNELVLMRFLNRKDIYKYFPKKRR